jgi:hypothetical protein
MLQERRPVLESRRCHCSRFIHCVIDSPSNNAPYIIVCIPSLEQNYCCHNTCSDPYPVLWFVSRPFHLYCLMFDWLIDWLKENLMSEAAPNSVLMKIVILVVLPKAWRKVDTNFVCTWETWEFPVIETDFRFLSTLLSSQISFLRVSYLSCGHEQLNIIIRYSWNTWAAAWNFSVKAFKDVKGNLKLQ